MLITDFHKLKNQVDSHQLKLDYRVQLLQLKLEDLLTHFNYGNSQRYATIFTHWTDLDSRIGFLTNNSAGTIKNDRTVMNHCVESYVNRRLVKNLLDLNLNINGKHKINLSEDEINEKVREIYSQLDAAQQKYSSSIVAHDVITSLGYETPSKNIKKEYTLLDLTDEIEFIKAYTHKSIKSKINKLDKNKLQYICAILDGKIDDIGFKSHMLDLLNYTVDGGHIDIEKALDYYFNKSKGYTDAKSKTKYIDNDESTHVVNINQDKSDSDEQVKLASSDINKSNEVDINEEDIPDIARQDELEQAINKNNADDNLDMEVTDPFSTDVQINTDEDEWSKALSAFESNSGGKVW